MRWKSEATNVPCSAVYNPSLLSDFIFAYLNNDEECDRNVRATSLMVLMVTDVALGAKVYMISSLCDV